MGYPSGKIRGRYRTMSCTVALAQNNSGQLITNKDDPDVWAIHQVRLVVRNANCNIQDLLSYIIFSSKISCIIIDMH